MTVRGRIRWTEWRWILVASLVVVTASSVPYLVAWSRESPARVFSGCILLFEDCASYLGKMRQGAEGAWLFHISYTPEEHPGTLVYLFHLLLGKVAALLPGGDLTRKLVLVYHLARVVFGLGLLLTVYGFLAALTERVTIRRLAWLMVAVGGGFGWLLTLLGKTRWLGDAPMDLFRSEGFAFITLYGFPHRAAAQSLLLAGFLCLWEAWDGGVTAAEWVRPGTADSARKPLEQDRGGKVTRLARSIGADSSSLRWATLAGVVWLTMGLIIPFYVAVAWVVVGASWIVLAIREEMEAKRPRPSGFSTGPLTGAGSRKSAEGAALRRASQDPKGLLSVRERVLLFVRGLPWDRAVLAGIAVVISGPVVMYNAWVFSNDPVYGAWAAQNQILSPHPVHYLAAYGPPLTLGAFAVKDIWNGQGDAWLALTWVAVVPLLVCLPVNVQFRLLTGFQVPLSLLAARGAARLWKQGRHWLTLSLLTLMIPTSVFLLASSSAWVAGRPFPAFRDSAEVAALEWLAARAQPGDVVLAAYDTGAYLPARVNARVLAGHDLEAVNAEEKKEEIDRFFERTTEETWRRQFLALYGVDYVFWGPAERALGGFDPDSARYLRRMYEAEGYALFAVEG